MQIIQAKNTPLLDAEQLEVLTRYANGQDEFDVKHSLGISQAELATIDKDIQARLSAHTKMHMISRAWQLGILTTRALCLMLVLVTSFHALDPNMARTRTPVRNSRPPTSLARAGRSGRNKEFNA
ncbi:hypothetical protein [Vibrio sp. H11]|uniref:hypothetical protein n=1 Tax=Vibrio sp. H11 TaxID=2565928 RepID=UPI0010A654E8|nr:hypothetical protein [Vibrio sp. H11]